LKLAAQQDFVLALISFAAFLEVGLGVSADPRSAAEYFKLGSDRGSPDGTNNLGRCLEFGTGTMTDLGQAVECYRSAGEKGHAGAQINYGFCLEHGRGCEESIERAADFYCQSAAQDHPDGSFHFALFWHYGITVDVDLGEASQHYDQAADPASLNSFRCRRALGRNLASLRAPPAFCDPKLAALNGQCNRLRQARPPSHDRALSREQLPLGTLLGWGGNATVKLEFNPTLGQTVAVKHIRAESYDADRFQREVTAMSNLRHPCIARIHESNCHRGSQDAEIHLEFAEHGSLQRVMENVQRAAEWFWTPTGKAVIICGIVLGMRFVHSKSYIHGDLKPSNILIKTGGTVLISDFGISRLESTDASSSTDGGTVHYSAPELYFNKPVCTRKTDVFCFGLVLYEIVTGLAVFPRSMYAFTVIQQLRSHDLPAVPDSCGWLMRDLIDRCWLREPASRPSFDDILHDFREADFELFPGVDRLRVREYVTDVLNRE
jgi:hypothetical protein